MHKKSRSIERDFVGFAYRHFDGFRFLFAIKSVISDKLAYTLVLPLLAGLILISQGVILGKRKRKVIDELTARRHGVVGAFLIVAVMFLAAAVKVVCRAYLENIAFLYVYIMPDVQKLLFPCLCANYGIPLFWQGWGRPALPRYFFGLRFCTSVNSKLSPPIKNAIWRSLFVMARSTIEN